MTEKFMIDGSHVVIDSIIGDEPGGFMVVSIDGEQRLIKLDNKQLQPIKKQVRDDYIIRE